MKNKFKKDRVQLFNPRGKCWVKVDTKNGRVLGHKKISWKNVKRSNKKSQPISMTYELSNKPIKDTLRVWLNKKELKLTKDYTIDNKNRYITLLKL